MNENDQQPQETSKATVAWIVVSALICGGIGGWLGQQLGWVGWGTALGLAVGAVFGFIMGVPKDKK